MIPPLPHGRRGRTRLRRALAAAGLLTLAAIAFLAVAHPASAAQQSSPPVFVQKPPPAGGTQVQLDALVKPAAVDAAGAETGGVCNLPGVGDLGKVLGACGPGSGITGDINGTCKTPPVPEAPADAASAWVQIKPARLPARGTVFGPNATSTEYQQYGYAGLSWSNYDMPCLIPQVSPTIETMLGNWELSIAKSMVAVDNTVHEWAASPSWMTQLIPVVTGSTSTLYRALFLTWAGVALLAVAISVAMRASHSDTPGAVTLVTWAVLVLGLVSAAVAVPGWAATQAQSLMSSTLSTLDAGFVGPGGQASANEAHDSLLVESVLYPVWVRGELGDPASVTAAKYGPLLFQEQALTWAQAGGSPAEVSAAVKAGEAAWTKTAAQVQTTDPGAYETLAGNSLHRMGAGFLAVISAIIVCTFDFIASLVVMAGLLSVLAGTVMLPAVGVAGLHHRLKHLITGLGSWVLGTLINAVLWAAAAGVDQVAARALLTQHSLPLPLALLLLAMLSVALWLLIRRLRGRPAVPPLARRAVMMGLGYTLLRRGARRGAEDALAAGQGPGQQPVFYQRPWSWRLDQVAPLGGPPMGPVPSAGPPLPGGPAGGGPRPMPPAPGPNGGGPRPMPPAPGPNGGGPRPLPPSPGPSGGNPNGSPSGPGRNWPRMRPPRPADGEYTGGEGGSDVVTPTNVFGPGESFGSNLDNAGLYTGGE